MIPDQDRLYPHIAEIITACPLQAGPLYTAFKDLALSVEWHDLRALQLPGTAWAIIIGHKRKDESLRAVLPLPLHTTALKPSSLKAIFQSLGTLDIDDLPPVIPNIVPSIEGLQAKLALRRKDDDSQVNEEEEKVIEKDEVEADEERKPVKLDRDMIYIAIATTDSTVVYYKISKGIKKPADVPDE